MKSVVKTSKKRQTKEYKETPNDVIYTPKPVAKIMIDMCEIKPTDKVLDPSRGKGVFFNNLPECQKDWCEITDGKNFFDFNERVDLVIGNPPYSIWSDWIEHTMNITDKFCYIFGSMNFTDDRLRNIIDQGFGVTKFHLLKIDWWFSPSYIIVFERGKPSIISVSETRIKCPLCNRRCGNEKDHLLSELVI